MIQKNKKKILVIGGGGHAKVICDAVLRSDTSQVAGYTDAESQGNLLGSIPYLGRDDSFEKIREQGISECICAIGSIGDTALREKVIENAIKSGLSFVSVVHPSAYVAEGAKLAEGVFISAKAVINPNASIGFHSIINTGAIIEHDCTIGAFCHVSPGAVLGGNVIVEDHVHVGLGARIIQGATIGNRSFVGVGSVVLKDVNPGYKVFGIPARAYAKQE